MRIIAGSHKGKKLQTFQGDEIRPTSDRARESLFNILNASVRDCSFLDLCSGTGAVGIEAYSRGAGKVTFVDVRRESMNLTKRNANSVGLQGEFCVCSAVAFLTTTTSTYDIIFFDPPYAFDGLLDVLRVVKERKLLNDGGVFIYERTAQNESVTAQGFTLYDSRKYGIAVFDFYKE